VDPPKVKRATPDFNSLNMTPSRIEIEFDENIKIEKPTEKVIITPPQKNMPVIPFRWEKSGGGAKRYVTIKHHLHHRLYRRDRR